MTLGQDESRLNTPECPFPLHATVDLGEPRGNYLRLGLAEGHAAATPKKRGHPPPASGGRDSETGVAGSC
jgi:hypothetical protein